MARDTELIYFGDARPMARLLWSESRHGSGSYTAVRLARVDRVTTSAWPSFAAPSPCFAVPSHPLGRVGGTWSPTSVSASWTYTRLRETRLHPTYPGTRAAGLVRGWNLQLRIQRDGEWIDTVYDRGVSTTVIPETLAGVVALDFVETLQREPTLGRCAGCGLFLVLTPQQSGRHRAGQAIYHPECDREHRLKYVREYQRQRRRGCPSGAGFESTDSRPEMRPGPGPPR